MKELDRYLLCNVYKTRPRFPVPFCGICQKCTNTANSKNLIFDNKCMMPSGQDQKKKIFIWNNEISPYIQDFHAKKKTDWHLKPFLSNQMSKIGLVLWEYLFWRDDSPVSPGSTLLPLEDIFANTRLSRDCSKSLLYIPSPRWAWRYIPYLDFTQL